MPTVNIADIEIFYNKKGSGDSFLIFPDNHLTSLAYKKEIDHFANRFEVIVFDYPTTGKSTHQVMYPDEREVDYWGFWADLACHLLNELKINKCIALGVGGGALTALHFAGKQAPQHEISLQRLILDSFLADWDTRSLHRWLDLREHFYVRNEKSLLEQHGEDWRSVVDEDTKFLRTLADKGGYCVPDNILNRVTCPTLLTGHLGDPTLPALAEEYARISAIIPQCSIFLADKESHPYIERPFMWTDPESFRLISDHFLDRNLSK